MFSHVMIGSNDIARSKKFYDALFVAVGGQPGVEDARGRLAYTHNGGRFMVSKPIDGKPAGTLPLYATWETVTGTELLPGLLQCHIFAISARAAAYSRLNKVFSGTSGSSPYHASRSAMASFSVSATRCTNSGPSGSSAARSNPSNIRSACSMTGP